MRGEGEETQSERKEGDVEARRTHTSTHAHTPQTLTLSYTEDTEAASLTEKESEWGSFSPNWSRIGVWPGGVGDTEGEGMRMREEGRVREGGMRMGG